MRVSVVGLGKIGLPLAAVCAAGDLRVTGCDISSSVVDAINRGECPLANEPEVPELIAHAVRDGRLRASTDTTAAVADSDVVLVVVPLSIDTTGSPDYAGIDSAIEAIGHGLRTGTLVVIETTLPVGDTRCRFRPMLERASGLRVGVDFFLAFSPERVQSTHIIRDLRTYPKIVGGVDPASTSRAEAFYRQVLDAPVMVLSSSDAAEFTKLAESVYRDVNIALANQLARYAEQAHVDMTEVIRAANSEPLSHLHRPGLGVGGHCIPVYPYFMLNRSAAELSLVETAREVNDSMPAHAAQRLETELGGLVGRTVLVLGLAYRPNVKEASFSPAIALAAELERRGARVRVNDPLFTDAEMRRYGVEPVSLHEVRSRPVDAVVMHSNHSAYSSVDVATIPDCRVVLDGTNALDAATLERAGIRYLRIGLGAPESAGAAVGGAV